MIWSLIKIIFFITIIALVTLVTGVIIDAGGVITMQFASYEISLTPIQGIIGIILCLCVCVCVCVSVCVCVRCLCCLVCQFCEGMGCSTKPQPTIVTWPNSCLLIPIVE